MRDNEWGQNRLPFHGAEAPFESRRVAAAAGGGGAAGPAGPLGTDVAGGSGPAGGGDTPAS